MSESTEVFKEMWNQLASDERAEIMLELTQSILTDPLLVSIFTEHIIEASGVTHLQTNIETIKQEVAILNGWKTAEMNLRFSTKARDNALGVY